MRSALVVICCAIVVAFVAGCGMSMEKNAQIIMMDFFTHEFRMEQGASIGKIAIKSIEKGKDGETYLIKGIAYALINGKESDLKYYFKADVKKINPKGMALVSFPKIIPDLEGKLTEDSMMINLFWNNDDEVFRRVMWGEFSK